MSRDKCTNLSLINMGISRYVFSRDLLPFGRNAVHSQISDAVVVFPIFDDVIFSILPNVLVNSY